MSDYLWKSPAWFNELIFKVYTCLINDPKIQRIVPVRYSIVESQKYANDDIYVQKSMKTSSLEDSF